MVASVPCSRLPVTTALRTGPAAIINAGYEQRSSSPFDSSSVCHVAARPPHLKHSSLSTLCMSVQPTGEPLRKAVRAGGTKWGRLLSTSFPYITSKPKYDSSILYSRPLLWAWAWPCATCLTSCNPHGNPLRVAFTVNPISQIRSQRLTEALAKSTRN